MASFLKKPTYQNHSGLTLFHFSSSDGKCLIKETVPDTITSWVATAFAVHNESGLGIAPKPANVCIMHKPLPFVTGQIRYPVGLNWICTFRFSVQLYKQVENTVGKGEIARTSNFSFSDSICKRLVLQTCKTRVCFGKC